MTSIHQAALAAAVVKALAAQVERAERIVKDQLHQYLDPGDRKHARLGELDLATISVSDAKVSPQVTDEAALIDYLDRHHPTEIERKVRYPFKRTFLSRLDVLDDGSVVDPRTGEILPFVAAKPRDPVVTVRQTPDQLANTMQAWADGLVAPILDELLRPELTEGGSGE